MHLARPALQPQPQLLALFLTVSCRIEYTLEVMKGGASLEKRSVHARDHYTFGRHPECDFHLEHPSISRVHAVLQFKAEGERAVLAGSSAACPDASSKWMVAPDGGCSARLRHLCHTWRPLSASPLCIPQVHATLQYRTQGEMLLSCTSFSWGLLMSGNNHRAGGTHLHAVLAEVVVLPCWHGPKELGCSRTRQQSDPSSTGLQRKAKGHLPAWSGTP